MFLTMPMISLTTFGRIDFMRLLRFPSPGLSDDSADCVSEGAQVEGLPVRVSCGRAFAQHNQQDGRKDKDDTDEEPESE